MKRFFGNWTAVTLTCAILSVLVLSVGLPFFVAGLRPLWVRLAFAVLILGLWGLAFWLRRRKAQRAAAALAAELSGPNAADEEGRALAQRMGEALTKLKAGSGKKRDYLYAAPWYVIIGPPGAGKTTALLNSGLHFPHTDQAVKGVGGTRNLDFWFADEAVLLDTAGRYTTQDSDYKVDASGWTSFLSLLRKHRPLEPINGVMVAIGVDELIRSDCARIDAHARAVRRRLVELRQSLEVAVPVYVVLTKADLLAGFTEYFGDLDVEGRRAVLGATLPAGAGKPSGEALARAFDTMAQAATDRQAKRLFEEVDAARRGLILGFPSQLQSLRSRLMRFLDGAFVSGDEAAGNLRGFYLTSGVQQGAPLDRILSGMADVYDRAPEPQAAGGGRAYFLNRLLTETLFPESGLVAFDPAAVRRRRTRLAAAFAGIGAAAVLTLGAWGVSYAANRSFEGELLARTEAAATLLRDSGVDLKQVRDGDADLRAVLPGLDALRALPRGYAERRATGAPLSMRFGLYQSGLSEQAEQTYREGLRRVLLPRLMLRLETYLQAHGGDPMALYEPLKVYLMLGQQGPMDAKAVRQWVSADWAREVLPGADAAPEREKLGKHLAALLEDKDLAAVWPGRKPPLDGDLVASARASVGTLSLADRAYAVMRQKAAGQGADWLVANVLSQGDAAAFANADQVLGARVPYFFTREGFEKAYTVGLATVQADLKRDLWVLGGDASTSGVQGEMANIRPGVAGLYAREYIAAWEGIVKLMQPGGYFSDPAAFGAFTKSPSPLKRVLLELRKNTIFAGGARGAADKAIAQRMSSMPGGRLIQNAGAGRATGLDAGAEITGYFEPLHDYVGDGKAPGPIDEFVAAIKQAGQAVIAAKAVGGGGGAEATQAAMAQAVAQVQAAAAGAPPQLQGFVGAAAGGGSTARVDAATGAVADAYAQTVGPACREVAQEHYPFFGAAQTDAATVDVLRVFGMGGTIDSFVQQRLKPMMETEGPVWRWRADDPVAAALSPASPEELAKAAQIRDLLVGGLPIKVALAKLGSGVGAVEIASGGTTYRFDAVGAPARPLLWSVSGGLPEASVTLFPVGAAATGAPAPLRKIEAEGPWALFKLMDQAQKENAGERAIKATFGEGAASVTFLIGLPSDRNPFSRGGIWSFRCPVAL
ncbi:type VI secretion system membrane subunit TssM [Sphingomonas sp. Y38-1Y]|uniref:type VI secretion system membrane subunit TssM n=1 Tax=Sphingomonas sp. Y38-1Y TaxID=3078265 RepID=UPI0028E36886|nr:type VI secretion system membrane subunit TssM [Sphingomonas sp. Y38-1Y]